MKSFFAGCCLALLLAGASIWAYDVFAVSSANRFAEQQTVHVEQSDNPRLHQGPPPVEPR